MESRPSIIPSIIKRISFSLNFILPFPSFDIPMCIPADSIFFAVRKPVPLLLIDYHFPHQVNRNHGDRKQYDRDPPLNPKRVAAKHISNPCKHSKRNQGRIYDHKLYKDNQEKYLQKSRILIQPLKDGKSVIPDIEAVVTIKLFTAKHFGNYFVTLTEI